MRHKNWTGPGRGRGAGERRSPRALLAIPASLAAVLALLMSVLLAPPALSAPQGVGLAIAPLFPPTVTVGDTNVAAQLNIGNDRSAGVGPVTLTQITLDPACGDASPFTPCTTPSLGVFMLSTTGTGTSGACTGVSFTISGPDVNGRYLFQPSAAIILQTPGDPNAGCLVDFTFRVLKVPPVDADAGSPGLQTRQFATVSGTALTVANPTTLSGSGTGSSITTVNRGTVGLTTNATATAALGQPISDTATVTAPAPPAAQPTGTIVFTLFGPDNATCTGAPVFTSAPVTITGGGAFPSGPFTPTAPGTYRWVASYSGDVNFVPIVTPCNAPNEVSVVAKATPTLTTRLTATGTATVGRPITDNATLAGLVSPSATGTITFNFYGPNNTTCTGTPVFVSTVTVATGNGTYPSGAFTPTVVGSYQVVASYSGDANNNAITTTCNDPNETLALAKATPVLTTRLTATGTASIGNPITDNATLSGLISPSATGMITFNFYGPNNTTCTGTPVFVSTVTVASGNGTYPSGAFTPTVVGSYQVVASYSGDTNNNAITTACNDPNETLAVAKATPALTTRLTATGPATLGNPIFDTATLSGLLNPTATGTITFNFYGPNSTTCSGTPIFVSTVTVANGNGAYPSESFTPTAVGSYQVVATYSGDASNSPVGTTCNDTNETIQVLPKPTIMVDKTATPLSRLEPGGLFTFNVVVTNSSAEKVKITALTDDIYGNIATKGTCINAIGTELAANGGTYTCSFEGNFTGKGGDKQTDIVTVVGIGTTSGDTVTDNDDAVVNITNVAPTIQVDKTAKPESLPAPTGVFTFTVVVTNTSTVPLKITKLTDDIYGDLSTMGTCKDAINTLLAANGGKYTCMFDGKFTGKAGDKQTDVVTATAVDDSGDTVTDTDDAIVTLTPTTTKVVDQQVNTVTPTNRTPSASTSTSTLPRTGSGAARLATLAAGLMMMGGLLLFASRWVPVGPLAPAGGLGRGRRR